ncbi:hypothetical protein L1887_38918 [Cichorium endivia]|nr:hypothetical protein L1887_38918 [Cichorium endivia]
MGIDLQSRTNYVVLGILSNCRPSRHQLLSFLPGLRFAVAHRRTQFPPAIFPLNFSKSGDETLPVADLIIIDSFLSKIISKPQTSKLPEITYVDCHKHQCTREHASLIYRLTRVIVVVSITYAFAALFLSTCD